MVDKNKILVIVIVPTINSEYNVFIPIGKTVGSIKNYLVQTIQEQFGVSFLSNTKLYDKESSTVFDDKLLIKNTGIKNGTQLLLI